MQESARLIYKSLLTDKVTYLTDFVHSYLSSLYHLEWWRKLKILKSKQNKTIGCMRTITKFFNPLCILSIAMLWLVEAKAQTGQSLHDQSNLDYLKSLSDKSTLNPS
jgi:hypothetical protein